MPARRCERLGVVLVALPVVRATNIIARTAMNGIYPQEEENEQTPKHGSNPAHRKGHEESSARYAGGPWSAYPHRGIPALSGFAEEGLTRVYPTSRMDFALLNLLSERRVE